MTETVSGWRLPRVPVRCRPSQAVYDKVMGHLALAATALVVALPMNTPTVTAESKLQIVHTLSGIRFGLWGTKGSSPAPTVFVLSSNLEDTLQKDEFNPVGRILASKGYLNVSLDLPCHGRDARAGEQPDSLGCWRRRLENGDTLVPRFVSNLSAVLDYLVQEGYTDPHQVAVWGASRGGFIALHFAAADSRIKCVAVYAPVTDLMRLSEFSGIEDNPAVARQVRGLALVNSAAKLAGQLILIYIGNYDERVSTDAAIRLSRAVVESSVAQNKPADLELRVPPSFGFGVRAFNNGHQIAGTGAQEEAAAWVAARMAGE